MILVLKLINLVNVLVKSIGETSPCLVKLQVLVILIRELGRYGSIKGIRVVTKESWAAKEIWNNCETAK